MIWYDMIWYDMIWYDMIWYMIWYDMIWYDVVWCGVVWCGVMWCDVVWYDRIGTVVKVLCYKSQMMSLEFFIDIILPIALRPWGRQKWVPGGFPGGKCGRCVRLTSLPPPCAVVMKSGNLNFLGPSGPLQACNGTDLPLPLLYLCIVPLTLQVISNLTKYE